MTEEELQTFNPGLKKKKKKNATAAEEETVPVDSVPASGGAADVLKKKKKKPFNLDSVSNALNQVEDDAAAAADGGDGQDADAGADLGLDFLGKKKKKKKKVQIELTGGEKDDIGQDQVEGCGDPIENTEKEHTYQEMLARVYDIMRQKNPDLTIGGKKKFVMKPPQIARVGTKKTAFLNFADICKAMKRQPKHLLSFILAELGTIGSVDANTQLIIKGRFQQKQIEAVLRKYIKEYVLCHTCRSPDTVLTKETRLFFLQCETCSSRCSVASIKTGFQALTSKRAALKTKQQQ